MIENIIKTQNGYRATVDGVELFIPDAPGNRHWQMVQDAIAEGAVVQPEPEPVVTKEQQEAARQAAYVTEADPLFFMSQRGEATTEEWLAKVQEIKTRYPYPQEA